MGLELQIGRPWCRRPCYQLCASRLLVVDMMVQFVFPTGQTPQHLTGGFEAEAPPLKVASSSLGILGGRSTPDHAPGPSLGDSRRGWGNPSLTTPQACLWGILGGGSTEGFFLKSNILFYVHCCFTCVSVCMRALDSLEMELQIVVSRHVEAGN